MSILLQLRKGNAKKFDALRKVYFPENTKIYLLQRIGVTNPFKTNLVVETGWYGKFNKLRFQYQVDFAVFGDDFIDVLLETSHLAIVTSGQNSRLVYAIEPSRREIDVLPNYGNEPWWHIFCQHKADDIFEIV